MPVSHLGLTVSHIPSATSFYLAALQPLGYRFIGQQGDSIGLGVDAADFFLTQSAVGTRHSPDHIAFLADSRLIVRDCYAAALTSGGVPSGAPSYRNDDCSCFNAAVEDLDGNTVEFVFRQPHVPADGHEDSASSEGSRVLDWQKGVAKSATEDDVELVVRSMVSRGSLSAKTSHTKSRMQTALDLAPTTSKSARSLTPSHGIFRTNTAPAKSDFPSRTLIGTAFGAVAGAALMYAMTRTESENAREEADHQAYMSSKSRRRKSVGGSRLPPPTFENVARTKPSGESQAPTTESRNSYRNYNPTRSASDQTQRPPHAQPRRMIEAAGFNKDDNEVLEVTRRYNSLRSKPTRSRTYDDYEYTPAFTRPTAPSEYGMKRASTMPVNDTDRSDYYPTTATLKENHPRRSSRYELPPKSYVSHSSRLSSNRRNSVEDQNLKRQDSGISVHSQRPPRDRQGESNRRSSASKASTIKPSQRDYDNTAPVTAEVPLIAGSKAPSSCYFPAAISLPTSKASSRVTTSERGRSHEGSHKPPTANFATPREPLVPSTESWEDFVAEESDGLGDIKTVLPEDSISMVGSSRPRRSRPAGHSSRSSETSTVRPVKEHRSRKDGNGKRSVHA